MNAIQGVGFKLQVADTAGAAAAAEADRDPNKVQQRTFNQEAGWAQWDQLDKAKEGGTKE